MAAVDALHVRGRLFVVDGVGGVRRKQNLQTPKTPEGFVIIYFPWRRKAFRVLRNSFDVLWPPGSGSDEFYEFGSPKMRGSEY